MRCTSKFRQNHHPELFLLAGNELKGNQVHSVSGGCDYTCIGNPVQGNQLIKVNRLVEKVDGSEFDCAVGAIDPAYQFIDCCSQLLVFIDVSPGGHSHLNKHRL